MTIAVVALISFVGILGMTFLFPLLAAVCSPPARRSMPSAPHPQTIGILIPAHNEEALLPTTLCDVSRAIQQARRLSPCSFRVLVGADGCTDSTAKLAVELGAEVIATPKQIGKWSMISQLVESCQETQWMVLADCGVTWPRDFLVRLLPLLTKPDVVGVAPTYRNDTSGLVERVVWGTERAIKRIESRCGGPVSVHGATVCYRAAELTETLQFLSAHHWLNDDIVIPLCIRALNPSKRLEYVSNLTVSEAATPGRPITNEFVRRRRLVQGNIQWIRHLWGPVWKHNYVAAILAGRRIFRLLWGYWALGVALTITLTASTFNFTTVQFLVWGALFSALFFYVEQLRRLLESGVVSLLAPYYFFVSALRPSNVTQVTRWR